MYDCTVVVVVCSFACQTVYVGVSANIRNAIRLHHGMGEFVNCACAYTEQRNERSKLMRSQDKK